MEPRLRSGPPAVDPAALLAVIHALAVELHPQRAEALRVTLESNLETDLAFDSLTRMELLTRIERRLGVTLPEQAVAMAETPGDLLRAAAGAGAAPQPARREFGSTAAAGAGSIAAGADVGLPLQASSLLEVLEWHVARQPARAHILLYEDEVPAVLTYEQLYTGARAVASGLLQQDVREGARIAIMLPTGLDYLFSFFGAICAGIVPVPIYPPARPSQIEDHLRRHAGILSNAGVRLLIAPAEARPVARLLAMHVESLRGISSVAELSSRAVPPGRPSVGSDTIAYLQYTSGSTGQPKGVVLSHGNVLANIRAMGAALKATPRDVFVSWLPLYHDMGLIGAWLGSLYYGAQLVLMSPLRFLARPERWLRAIHAHRGTLSGGPNFGYELCVRLAHEQAVQGLDLSCWRVAFNGAEPVIPETLERFTRRFAAQGFRPEALMPVYGLAENGVGLAFPPLGRGPWIDRVNREALMRRGVAAPADADDAHALRFPACGAVLPGHELRVTNEAGTELGEREEGRIEFRGPSATRGYFRNPEATQALLRRGWLDTGDVGYLARGEVFLTGRRKDIIIRGGRHLYPHELEEAIGGIDGVRKGCVAVFGTADPVSGTERVVALAETRLTDAGRREGLRRAIDAAAVDLLGTALDDVVLVQPHTVPKTSSGKIRRAASRELYEGGVGRLRRRGVRLQILRIRLAGVAPELRRARRLVADGLYGVWGLACIAVLAVPVWLGVACSPRPAAAWAVLRGAARLLFRLMGVPLAVRGLERLPVGKPCILMLNHSSYLDGLVLASVFPGAWSVVAKRELARNPFFRIPLDRLGTLYVERFDAQRSAEDARALAQAARQGRSLAYFPEGTFTRMSGLLPFYLGGFAAAIEVGLPVVPAVIRGTRSMLRDGQWLPRRGFLSVVVCPPLHSEGQGFSAAVALRDRTRSAMLPLVGEPDLAAETGVVARLAPSRASKAPP